jgi:hypothetical protein
MTPGLVAMLAGLFVAPAAMLWLGHRLRRRTARARGAFWGAVIGHSIAIVPALVVAMTPPATWSDGDVMRGFLGFWLLPIGAVVGGAIGWVAARSANV